MTQAQQLLALCLGLLLLCTLCAADPWKPAPGAKSFSLDTACPGNLVVNGGFETPNPAKLPTEVPGHGNSRWGWYSSKNVPGWKSGCVHTDWETATSKKYLEIHHNSVEVAPEGFQILELLPNGTGAACQEVALVKGAKYRLRFMYGRLMTYAWRPPYVGEFVKFETSMAVGIKDAAKPAPNSPGEFARNGVIKDSQGYQVLANVFTKDQPEQWQQYDLQFTAPASKVSLLFTTTSRSKECGSCGSLLDAVCLQKV